MKENATFYSFKESGKWYASGRGHLSEKVFKVFGRDERRDQIVCDNNGEYPGLNGPGWDFTFVVIPDEETQHGYPLLLRPIGG